MPCKSLLDCLMLFRVHFEQAFLILQLNNMYDFSRSLWHNAPQLKVVNHKIDLHAPFHISKVRTMK